MPDNRIFYATHATLYLRKQSEHIMHSVATLQYTHDLRREISYRLCSMVKAVLSISSPLVWNMYPFDHHPINPIKTNQMWNIFSLHPSSKVVLHLYIKV